MISLVACCVAVTTWILLEYAQVRHEKNLVKAWGKTVGIKKSSHDRDNAGRPSISSVPGSSARRHRTPPWRSPFTQLDGAHLALLVADVAGRLRGGAPTGVAWETSWKRFIPDVAFAGIDEVGTPLVLMDIIGLKSIGHRIPRSLKEASLGRWIRSVQGSGVIHASKALDSACRLSGTTGAPLAHILDAVADGLEDAEAVEEARRIASEGSRMSTRILLAMPLMGVIAAQALGAEPLKQFVSGGIGTVLAIVGLTCMVSAYFLSRYLMERARGKEEAIDPALACDLARAVLESGAAIPSVIESLGEATRDDQLARIGRELRLGVSWERAWEERAIDQLALALHSAWVDGIAPDDLLSRTARQIRARRLAEARTRAEALGVTLVVPLGSLLLPAFLALGLGPIIVHLMGDGIIGLG